MSKRPNTLKANEIIRILERLGYIDVRHPDGRQTTVRDYGARELIEGTFRSIVKDTGLSLDAFLSLR